MHFLSPPFVRDMKSVLKVVQKLRIHRVLTCNATI